MYVPPGKLHRQSDVLSLFADRQRQLLVVYDNHSGLTFFIDPYLIDGRWTERPGNKHPGVVRPGNDINPFPAQFTYNSLNTRTLHSHAGTHRINCAVLRIHSDLRPLPGFSDDIFDQNEALADLRHLHLKKSGHKFRRCPGYENSGTLCRYSYVFNDRLYRVTPFQILGRQRVFDREYGLSLSEVDVVKPFFLPHYRPRDDLTRLVLKFAVNNVSLCFPHPLEYDLFSRLRGNPAKVMQVKRDIHCFTFIFF